MPRCMPFVADGVFGSSSSSFCVLRGFVWRQLSTVIVE